jgi:hypothetical protein
MGSVAFKRSPKPTELTEIPKTRGLEGATKLAHAVTAGQGFKAKRTIN